MKNIFLIAVLVTAFSLTSCASAGVSRVSSSAQIDLSGYWNDTDVRLVCDDLVNKCLAAPGVSRVIKEMKRTPVAVVLNFKNDSQEHIDTEIITTMLRQAIINDGTLDFVAGGDQLAAIREERADQDDWGARDGTGNDLLNEIGADFALQGSVKTILDKSGNQTVRTYFVTAQLANVSTKKIIWEQTNSEIKKVVVQSKVRL